MITPIDKTLPGALNIASTLAVLWLYVKYGSLCGWWTRLFLGSPELQAKGSTFHAAADGIYTIVLVLLMINVGSAYCMLTTNSARSLNKTALAFACVGLVLCVAVQF